ncbi:hypothetical protein [Aliikangiella maris]|uniref:Uncharacterized protein n=2 Tax=Aliikangiella maris TaxID=3162458 RepID=A0ABV3MV77_9GAMM
MILKTTSRWPSLLGITQGGAIFSKRNSYSTSLSGIHFSFQFPSSILGNYSLIPPKNSLDITTINWEESIKKATRFFEPALIARETWWYWGSFLKTGFDPIGHFRTEWQVAQFENKYSLKSTQPEDVIDYLSAFIDNLYEGPDGKNERIRQSCYEFYVENGGYPVEHYQSDIEEMIERRSLPVPNDFKIININQNSWIQFSAKMYHDMKFHILPLNKNYFLVNLAHYEYDCSDLKHRWVEDASKILDVVIQSAKVEFPK